MVRFPGHVALRPGRQLPEGFRGAGLIPVGDTVEKIGPLDVPAVFGFSAVTFVLHRHLQRRAEVDGIEHMPAVADAAIPRAPSLPARLPEPVTGARPEAPGIVEIVLAARPLQARDLLAIDVEEIVSFAEPAILRQRHRHHRTDILSAAFDIGNEVVAPHHGGILLPIAGRLCERHVPVTGEAAGRRDLNRQALDDGGPALADGEELAEGHLDARLFPVIPVDAQAQRVEFVDAARVTGEPDVVDDARPLQDRHLKHLSWRERRHIEVAVVPVGLFVAGDTPIAAHRRHCEGA